MTTTRSLVDRLSRFSAPATDCCEPNSADRRHAANNAASSAAQLIVLVALWPGANCFWIVRDSATGSISRTLDPELLS